MAAWFGYKIIEAGVNDLQYAIEHGSPEVRRSIGKRIVVFSEASAISVALMGALLTKGNGIGYWLEAGTILATEHAISLGIYGLVRLKNRGYFNIPDKWFDLPGEK